jgi:hypothetical protein
MADTNKSLQKTQPQAMAANPLQALHQQFDAGRFNLLAPKIHVGQLPAGTQLAVREVRVDVDPNNKEVYPTDGGNLGLGKVALNKIAAAAGVSWVSSERTDDRRHPHYCEFTVHGRVTDFDGTVRDVYGSKTYDLRDDAGDGEPGKDVPGMSDRQLAQARKFVTEHCETKAKLRAIAEILAVKRSYSKAELAKPFIVPKLVPDTSNPMAQQMVLAQMTGAMQALYGGAKQAGPVIDATLEPQQTAPVEPSPEPAGDEGGADAPAAPPSEPNEAPSAPDASEPPHDPATGEVRAAKPTAEEIKQRTGAAWNALRRANPRFTEAAWYSLLKSNAGSTKTAEYGWAELDALDAAVSAYVANLGGAQ